MNTPFETTLTDYAKTFIRLKARRLIGHYGFTQSDRDDIERELMLDLLARLVHFDTTKGRLVTFVRVVVDRRVASLIRQRKAMSRDYRRSVHSLDDLRDDVRPGRLGEPFLDNREQLDLAMDLADALNSLPEDLRVLAEDLRDLPLVEVARQHGYSREVMRRKARQIRQHFADRGIGEYLDPHHN